MANKDEDVQIKTFLNPGFAAFPDPIGREVLRLYTATLRENVAHLRAGTVHSSPWRFSIREATCVRPSSIFEYVVVDTGIHHASLANVELLKYFLANHGSKLVPRTRNTNPAGGPEPVPTSFVHLATQDSMYNPEFVHLHSVRYGEVGWGFDAAGCLSFYWVEMVGGRSVVGVLFVERAEDGGGERRV
jgi:hypothetical protein